MRNAFEQHFVLRAYVFTPSRVFASLYCISGCEKDANDLIGTQTPVKAQTIFDLPIVCVFEIRLKFSVFPPPPPPQFTGKFIIVHTNYFSVVQFLYSCRTLAEFEVNHVCYCDTMKCITQTHILQQNGCYSITWIPTL